MKITDIIDGPVTFDKKRGQGLFVRGTELLAVITTFPLIWKAAKNRYFDQTDAYHAAEQLHIDLGNWLAEAINEKLEREKNKA